MSYNIRIQEPFSYFYADVKVSKWDAFLNGYEAALKNKAKEIYTGAVILDIRVLKQVD